MKPHVHLSAVHGLAVLAIIIVVFGTLNLATMTVDNRFTRAIRALGL